MKLGEGAKGIAYTVKCDSNDPETICYMLKALPITNIVFYEVKGEFKVKDPEVIKDFIKHLEKAERFAAKTFKRKLFINRKEVFDSEVKGIREAIDIFGDDCAKITTFMPLRFYSKQIIALEAHSGSDVFYSVFNERCLNTLENIDMNRDDIIKMVEDMLKSFISLQDRFMAHTDVKPANIVKCEKRYKLIDWEMMRDIRKEDYGIFKRASASMMFSSPWSNYISGLPVFYASRFITHGISRRMPKYYKSKEFADFRTHMETEFEKILKWDKDEEYLYDKYANTIDVYSLASSINYLCWKNKIDREPFIEWIKVCSGAHPPKNARESYKLWKKLVYRT